MSMTEAWFSLSARIHGVRRAIEIYTGFSVRSDSFGMGKFLREQCQTLLEEVRNFRDLFGSALPMSAEICIRKFFTSNLVHAILQKETAGEGAQAGIIALIAFEAEMTFLLSGRQEHTKRRSERAFLLLQRQLVVDEEIKAKWQAAKAEGEVACERLGSVHLLSQGIYAFKATERGVTDLVFGEPLDEGDLARAVDGAVLTEWKVLRDGENAERKFGVARNQVAIYQKGTLGGLDLTSYRYLILVSDEAVTSVPPDMKIDEIIYRHINIAVSRKNPSREAEALAKSGPINEIATQD